MGRRTKKIGYEWQQYCFLNSSQSPYSLNSFHIKGTNLHELWAEECGGQELKPGGDAITPHKLTLTCSHYFPTKEREEDGEAIGILSILRLCSISRQNLPSTYNQGIEGWCITQWWAILTAITHTLRFLSLIHRFKKPSNWQTPL